MNFISKIKEFFKEIPSASKWKYIFHVFSKTQKRLFILFLFLAGASLLTIGIDYYHQNTIKLPARGGSYIEGVTGQPHFINPIYLSNNDLDRKLVELIFTGLLDYNKDGEIVKDLAKNYKVKEEGKKYIFTLKNAKWQDGKSLTAEDIIFTLKIIQSPQYKSSLSTDWMSVTAKKVSPNKVSFHLQNKYSSFLETVAKLKIIPKHVFKNVSPKKFPWVLTSKKYIVGSGPYKLEELEKTSSGFIKRIDLERNPYYYGKTPYIENLSFQIYKDSEKLINAARGGEIDGLATPSHKYLSSLKKSGLKLHKLEIPRYFALFFNFKDSAALKGKKLRKAISHSINKSEIIEKVFHRKAEKVNSPILPDYFEFNKPKQKYSYNPEKTREILKEKGYKLNSKTGIREKKINPSKSIFGRDLEQRSEGEAVRKLQKCLAKNPSIYPSGKVTGYFGPKTKRAVINFQEKYAEEILHPLDLKTGTGKVGGMTREKLNIYCSDKPAETKKLSLTLTTTKKFPLLNIAKILKSQLELVGIKINLKKVSITEFQVNVLNERDYELLLFGEALGTIPDPFSFWHSSQKEKPGLNITKYNSSKADKLLEEARQTRNKKKRENKLEEFQKVLLKDIPATFLVRGDYLYFLSPDIKGFKTKRITSPSERFNNIENWYINTKRIWK